MVVTTNQLTDKKSADTAQKDNLTEKKKLALDLLDKMYIKIDILEKALDTAYERKRE